MPIISRPSMPPAVQATLDRAWVQDATVDASHPDVPTSRDLSEASFGNLIARQPRFRFAAGSDASTGAAGVIPETAAAERLAAAPNGGVLLDMLAGVRALEPRARITGIALSTTNNGAAANTVLNDLEARRDAPIPTGDDDDQVDAFQSWVEGASTLRMGGLGSEYDLASGWMLLGPEHSAQLLQAAGLPTASAQRGSIGGEQGAPPAHVAAHAAVVLAHEAAHAVTPPTYRDFEQAGWLEEATANLMVNLPGARERIRSTIGVDVGPAGARAWHRRPDAASMIGDTSVQQRSVRDHYPHETAQLARVLALAGLDTGNEAHEAQIRELLQGAKPSVVPERLAAAIGNARGLESDAVMRVAAAIRDGSPAAMDELKLTVR